MDTDGRPAMQRHTATEGQWLGNFYVVLARGGKLEVIHQCHHYTAEEIMESGRKRRVEAKRARTFNQRLRQNPVDDNPPSGQQ